MVRKFVWPLKLVQTPAAAVTHALLSASQPHHSLPPNPSISLQTKPSTPLPLSILPEQRTIDRLAASEFAATD